MTDDDVPLVVPFEYRKAGIATPEAAATYSADIIGFVSCHRARDGADRAEKRGAHGEAAFYRAVLDILLEWYDKPAEPVKADKDLPELDRSEIDPDWSAPAPPPPRKRRKPKTKATPKTKPSKKRAKSKRTAKPKKKRAARRKLSLF